MTTTIPEPNGDLQLHLDVRVQHPEFGAGVLKAMRHDGRCAIVWDDGERRIDVPRDEFIDPLEQERGLLLEEQVLDQAAAFAREVTLEAHRLRVREAARDKVRALEAGQLELPAPINLADFLTVPDTDATYRVNGLWPIGGRVVLSAQHKAGKTTNVGNLIRALVDGQAFLDQYPVSQPNRVLLIDNELDQRMLRRWLREHQISNTAAVRLVALRGRTSTFNILDPATRTRWADLIHGTDVLLFDCLRPALDALGLSEDKEAGRFLEALDELTTEAGVDETLVVHHMGHAGERSRGDSRILDWPDAVWNLVRDDKDERFFKAYGRDVDQPEARIGFDPSTRRQWIAGGTRRDQHIDEALEVLIDRLADQADPLSGRAVEDLMKGTDLPRNHIREALKRGIEAGQILVETGERNAQLHYLNPSVRQARRSAPSGTGALVSSAPPPLEGGALAHSDQPALTLVTESGDPA